MSNKPWLMELIVYDAVKIELKTEEITSSVDIYKSTEVALEIC